MGALEGELRIRRLSLDALASEARAAEKDADRARALAAIEQSSAEAVDELLDRRLADRLEKFEQAGRRWDISILIWSAFLGLPIGIAAGFLGGLLVGN